ncbi:MAG: Ig-like domain-containing protein [Coprobacillus sp.]|nr:Ig-like domain-containing protein [Coprobacillus sp.]
MKKLPILLMLCALLLTGCNNSETETPTDETDEPGASEATLETSYSFEELVNLLWDVYDNEANFASSAEVIVKDEGGANYISNETYTFFTDGSSASKGTLTYEDTINSNSKKDTFSRRAVIQEEKYDIDNTIETYDMFISVLDYDNETISNNYYKDRVAKVFVANSTKEATEGGLEEGEYILRSEYPNEASAKVTYELMSELSTLYSNANIYNQQVSFTNDSDGNYLFFYHYGYSYAGDLDNTTTETIDLSFTLSSDMKYLYTTKYEYEIKDVSNSDPDDIYVSKETYEATLTYGDKIDVTDDVIDVNDYFLSEVTSATVYDTFGNKYDNLTVDTTVAYLVIKADTYTPEKASNVELINESSSNQNVIELTSSNMFHVLSSGSSTLRVSYTGRNEEGIYTFKYLELEVKVEEPVASSISFGYNFDVTNNILNAGSDYTYSIYISPSKAEQKYTASSDNEEVLTVEIDASNDLIIHAVAPGTATVTLRASTGDNVTASRTFIVNDPSQDYTSVLCDNTWYYYDIYGYSYELTLNFYSGGTCSVSQYVFSNSATYQATSTYTLVGQEITIASWTDSWFDTYLSSGTVLENDGVYTLNFFTGYNMTFTVLEGD